MQFRWAIVDIETTGLNVLHDRITEIAVMLLTEEGIERTWHSLINPQQPIPALITQLTGISNSMVKNAPSFAEIAEELITLLDGTVLVAHNARFDFGFLKNAFKESEFSLRLPVLCTIKLFKQLYPQFKKYNLKVLASEFSIENPAAHRAQGDVDTLYQLLSESFVRFSCEEILAVAKQCYSQSALPSKLTTNIQEIPDSPGVYLFFGAKSNFPLYIGKSVTLRQRIMSHFQGDHSSGTEFAMAQQVERVEYIPTAGELSALLLESALIKEKMPLYNRKLRRKNTVVGFKLVEQEDYLKVEIVRKLCDPDEIKDLYGSFRSIAAAKANLLERTRDFELCPKLCSLEQSKTSCFSYQLKRCHGACIQEEDAAEYNARVHEALDDLKLEQWPYPGSIAIQETCPINKISHFLVFNQWRHLGTVQRQEDLKDSINSNITHDFDAYQILQSYLKNRLNKEQLLLLS
ncbi:MAG: DNA polymerase III subunit epsilon [Legionella sp.]|nr:MAG: DNA polymerase III subunit epsilon [Legionella sp.]